MARKPAKRDTETTQGVMIVAALIIGASVLGVGMHYFWQRYYNDSPAAAAENGSHYQSLGQQAIRIGDYSLLVQFTVEYEGWDTAGTLKKKLPKLQNQVMSRLYQIQTSDLRKLRTTQGKQELADDVLARVRGALPESDAQNVKDVLYEKFLIGE